MKLVKGLAITLFMIILTDSMYGNHEGGNMAQVTKRYTFELQLQVDIVADSEEEAEAKLHQKLNSSDFKNSLATIQLTDEERI